MPNKGYDFAGYATKNDIRCTDGTVIRRGCFHDMDGKTVPLVWQHQHNSVGEVLGHAVCEERPDGLYVYAYCNDTPNGRNAKEAVRHGDVNAFSIWANNIKRKGSDILHGVIREVSLVLAGADRTAVVDTIAHGDMDYDEIEHSFEIGEGEAEIAFLGGYGDIIVHEDSEDSEASGDDKSDAKDDEKTVQDVLDTFTPEQRDVLNYIVGKAIEDTKKELTDNTEDKAEDDKSEDDRIKHAEENNKEDTMTQDTTKKSAPENEETIQDVLDTFNEKQRLVLNYIVGKAIEDAKKGKTSESDEDDTDATDDESENDNAESNEEDKKLKHNAFDTYGETGHSEQREFISHDQFQELLHDAKTLGGGSLKEAYSAAIESGAIAHADGYPNGTPGTDYGIKDIDYMFPDAKAINPQPDFITRNMDWVDVVLNTVHRTPFARVKSIHANITEEEARARGYLKGKYKKEEVFTMLKRATYPQTITCKQRIDKDDIDDITDFDILVWLKGEMQMMLREEVARAILIGDGRETSDDDKIHEANIRPVAFDDDLYTIKFPVEVSANATDDEKAKALLKAQLKARKLYKGSGNMTFYTTEDNLTNVLLLENGIGERMYKSEAEVATAMRVAKIQTVEPMTGLKIEIPDSTGNTKTKYDVAGVSVNLQDYNVGTNGGAKTDFFDDFDLDTNTKICLYETRLSGASVKPYSAVTFYFKPTAAKPTSGSSTSGT